MNLASRSRIIDLGDHATGAGEGADWPRLVGQPGWDAYPARLLVAIVDNYHRELAHLAR